MKVQSLRPVPEGASEAFAGVMIPVGARAGRYQLLSMVIYL